MTVVGTESKKLNLALNLYLIAGVLVFLLIPSSLYGANRTVLDNLQAFFLLFVYLAPWYLCFINISKMRIAAWFILQVPLLFLFIPLSNQDTSGNIGLLYVPLIFGFWGFLFGVFLKPIVEFSKSAPKAWLYVKMFICIILFALILLKLIAP